MATNAGSFELPGGPAGLALGELAEIEAGQPPSSSGAITLANGLVSAIFEGPYVVSLKGTDGRECVPPGQRLGEFHLHQDFPNAWDAWDVDYFYRGSLEVLPDPEVQQVWADETGQHLRTVLAFGESKATTTWTLAPGSDALDVRVDVDWHEHERILKLALPVDVHTEKCEYETQFGYNTRPITTNTSWEAYRFEVSALRWIRVSDPAWGLAIANESTYGWDVTRQPREGGGTFALVRASLLRGPRFPDPETDQGEHTFAFALQPGASVVDAVRQAHRVNLPARIFADRTAARTEPIVKAEGAVVESVRLVDGDLVVRLYEPSGVRQRAKLTCPSASTARGTDLLYRDNERAVPIGGGNGEWEFELGPFQVATIRLGK
ncbi:MAG: glycosyl hydrolase-related protein [Propionibacteriaceae bacterium]|nr:glycosyl hydrolase-related protein [Propionibacteriaceae bacterium]